VYTSRHVTFDETVFPFADAQPAESTAYSFELRPSDPPLDPLLPLHPIAPFPAPSSHTPPVSGTAPPASHRYRDRKTLPIPLPRQKFRPQSLPRQASNMSFRFHSYHAPIFPSATNTRPSPSSTSYPSNAHTRP
jgi:hypothetical protein